MSDVRLTLRVPEALADALTDQASREGRSVNALIVRTLQQALRTSPKVTSR